ncbi:MAG: VTT domain-containing protein [Candidatus Thiodiazotropha sp.]
MTQSILEKARNCWCVEAADRVGVIIDAADYFAAFAEACRSAQRRIIIVGWDFDRRERLYRDDAGKAAPPERLGEFLLALLQRRPALHVYLLSWDFNMIYAAERELLPALRLRMQMPQRFHFRLDGNHPSGASHHQKIVVIDDRVAFVGGIDLSRWRWDTSEHLPDDPRRRDPEGSTYAPFHDLMMAVEGRAARRLGELAYERWRRAQGHRLKPLTAITGSPWSGSVDRVLKKVDLAIARTEPAYRGRSAVREVRQLHLDAIAAARRFIYIENQYFTARVLSDALIARLEAAEGPEVILVLPKQTGGWLEQATMDVLRGREVARLRKADRFHRLRVYYPHQPGLGDACISVHAKLLIVDDRFLKIGSANASNRSMGFDTECDLALESTAADDGVATFIAGVRRRLLAEHLECTSDEIAAAEARHPSLIPAIEQLRDNGRSLRDLDCSVAEEIDELLPDASLIDPPEPFSSEYFLAQYVPSESRKRGHRRLVLFAGIILGLLALAAAWRWSPMHDWLSPQYLNALMTTLQSPGLRAVASIVLVILASLLMVPLVLLAVLGGIVFQGWQAFVYVFMGAVASAALGFMMGRHLSSSAIERFSGTRIENLSRRLAKRGTLAVALLRLVPVAPFTVFNLVAGASPLKFRQFLVGSMLGMMPGLAAITLFSSSLWAAALSPNLENVAVAVGIGALLLLFAWLARRWLRSG